ncbi:hypothetical protein IP70_04390 [alpha proteobacterium AAP38]|nr:hypothetical protein IP70_04390 [alpha proteobacterium AAP38]
MDDVKARASRLQDIARQAGVSVSTVSRALSGSSAVNAETRRRIRELAEAAQYDAPPRRARQTTGGDRPSVMVVMPPAHAGGQSVDPFSLGLVGGISLAMRERGLDLTIGHATPVDQRGLADLLDSSQADGMIFLGQSQLHEALNRLFRDGRRFVVWGATAPDQDYCSVGSDNVRGGHRAALHLARLGRKRIAFLGETLTIELSQRHQGYVNALQEVGLAPDPSLHRRCRLVPDAAVEAVDDLLDQGVAFDAIVAVSDLVAIGAVRALNRRGLSVPHDVAIVGYDDIEIAAHAHPALTTIRQDTAKAGRLLVAKLLRLLAGDQAMSERLSTDLIVRESCGA